MHVTQACAHQQSMLFRPVLNGITFFPGLAPCISVQHWLAAFMTTALWAQGHGRPLVRSC
jgi:hypothetical protein